MSQPGTTTADIERMHWKVPKTKKDLGTRIVKTFDELKALFPNIKIEVHAVDQFSVFKRNNFAYYTYEDEIHFTKKMAYYCPNCKQIVIGAPRIENYDNIAPLAGSKGIRFYCEITRCSILHSPPIYEEAHERSLF